jgi:hypothetical protein
LANYTGNQKMSYVDHNPDDPTLISRRFQDPFARLVDIHRRIKTQKYFDITLGNLNSDKYLYELYYDFLFLCHILSSLDVMPKVSDTPAEHVVGNVSQIVNAITEKLNNRDRVNGLHDAKPSDS